MNDLTTPKPFACKADGCGLSFTNEDHLTVHEKKHEMSLSLSFEQKSANIFVADQTPTPTRLIKNCEEVGLFEDLRHVNPFDETFRRAVEQKTQSNLATDLPVDINSNSHDSLHTPQVFPNIENPEQNITCQQSVVTPLPKPSPSPVLEPVRNAPTKSHKVLPTILPKQPTKLQQGSTIHLIQPQVIALSFPTPSVNSIPIQTVKPFVLPKNDAATTNLPPSTLPIKERLKAILNSNSKAKQLTSGKLSISQESKNSKNEQAKHSFDDDCLERKRAASLRYRNKIKTEHLDLKRKNTELLSENIRLKEEIKKLHSELDNLRNSFADTSNQNQVVVGRAPEIQIPPSTVRLIMNIPQVVIRPTGQAVMKSPVTVSIKKD